MTRPRTINPTARTYQQVVAKLLRHNALGQLRRIIEKTLPADVAPVVPLLAPEDQKKLLLLLSEAGKAARVLLEVREEDLTAILDDSDDSTIAAVCNSSAPDDAADLLDLLEPSRREALLSLLEATEGANLEPLLVHEEETAGSLMTTDYLALDENLTVSSAIEEIRQYPHKDSFFYVYTINGDEQLVGVLSLRSLILASSEELLRRIMVQNVVRTNVDATQEDVAKLVSKYDLLSVPVVDYENRLVGVVTVDDVLDVIQEEAEEDLYHLAGVGVSDRAESAAFTSFRMRFPWLVVNLATAFIAASVVKTFEGTIEKWAALAAFMPIVAGMGGNAGTQTLTVFVRGLALGTVDLKSGFGPVLKELIVGLSNGFACGILTGLVIWLWTGDLTLGLIMLSAMTFNMMIAGVAGGVIPLVLKQLGFDPAISSSIFVTTFTDVGGFFAFLGLATLAIQHLR